MAGAVKHLAYFKPDVFSFLLYLLSSAINQKNLRSVVAILTDKIDHTSSGITAQNTHGTMSSSPAVSSIRIIMQKSNIFLKTCFSFIFAIINGCASRGKKLHFVLRVQVLDFQTRVCS